MKSKIILVTLVVLWGCYSRTPNVKTGLEGKPMPAIELIAVDSVTRFNTAEIPEGKPTILFSFETNCPYCRAQTRSMISQIEQLKDLNIVMICNTSFPEFLNFYNHYKLNKYANIRAGFDYYSTFVKYFKVAEVPYMAIYDPNKNLKQVLVGKNYITTIKQIALN